MLDEIVPGEGGVMPRQGGQHLVTDDYPIAWVRRSYVQRRCFDGRNSRGHLGVRTAPRASRRSSAAIAWPRDLDV